MTLGKRLFDLVIASAGALALAPRLVVLAALVKLEDGGPVLFRQERVGRGGRTFRIIKFRSMRTHAEHLGPELTVGADPRITHVGGWMRLLKLDELPQLVNVIRGEMSLVGPRPEVPRYVAQYTAEQRAVLDLVPGITDPASITYVDEAALLASAADPERYYVDVLMPDKIRLNLQYAQRATRWSDVRVILQTIGFVLPERRPSHAARSVS